jgi:hypothetical protein
MHRAEAGWHGSEAEPRVLAVSDRPCAHPSSATPAEYR